MSNQSIRFCTHCGGEIWPNEQECAACKQSEGGQGKWEYVETAYGAYIKAGDIYRLDAHWTGLGGTNEVRRIMKLASLAPVLRDALDAVMSGQLGGNVDYHADRFVDARSALASARGEGEGKANE